MYVVHMHICETGNELYMYYPSDLIPNIDTVGVICKIHKWWLLNNVLKYFWVRLYKYLRMFFKKNYIFFIFTYTPSILMFLGYVYTQDVAENLRIYELLQQPGIKWLPTGWNSISCHRQGCFSLQPCWAQSADHSVDTGDPLPRAKPPSVKQVTHPNLVLGLRICETTLPHTLMMMCRMHLGNFSYFIQKLILDTKIIAYFFTTTLRSVYWNIKQTNQL